MTSCEYPVDQAVCGHPAHVRVVRVTGDGRPHPMAICMLHAPDAYPIVSWAPIR